MDKKIGEEEILAEFLRTEGLKLTNQRRSIIKEIFSSHDHFDAEELFKRMKEKGWKASRASIYRTLKVLVELGFLRIIDVGKKCSVYEHIYGHSHHEHLICIGCGKIMEFSSEEMERLQDTICDQYRFKPSFHRLQIYGYCEECIRAEEEGRE